METVHRQNLARKLRSYLPEGRALPDAVWASRHRFVLAFIYIHAVGLTIFGLIRNWAPEYAIGEGLLIGGVGLLAAWPRLGRQFRSTAAAFAAATSSAVLTQFWGGYIEGHFHYFIVVALIALYQDWVPFILAIGFVALDHGLIGSLAPTWVYNHPAAIANPWLWAVIHAVLVLGECAVLIVLWKATERARARTDLVLASAGEGILGLDLDRKVTFVNPAAASMLRQSEVAIVGQSVERVLVAGTDAASRLDLARLQITPDGRIRQGAGQVVLQRNGTRLPLDWSLNPVLEHDTPVGFVLTLTDATQRERAQDERAQRLQQLSELERLQELDKFKTLFINTAAHELHTPLTPLRLQLYSLREGHKGELTPDQLSAVDVLDRNVERMSHLVEDVLNAARLQANRMAIQKASTDLVALVQEAADSFADTARAAGLTLETRLAPNVWVMSDAKRLMQVLYNLLDNAIKFTPRGGRVTLQVAMEGGDAVIRVSDTGVGIPSSEVPKLFQPFSQAHNPMEQTRVGSGLGLYISRGIIDLHGGLIECRSDGAQRGSTFIVRLPLPERDELKPEAQRPLVSA